jgi:hypothetical protein
MDLKSCNPTGHLNQNKRRQVSGQSKPGRTLNPVKYAVAFWFLKARRRKEKENEQSLAKVFKGESLSDVQAP